ncbi:putative ATP-dependent RNA helicase DDX60 [Galemys pyrenaicus]|uniref:Putative ATP-dependent RNA helicase DDX60 n=1 Tax=Galemys pyrenaicus TaxID=202257 RepID=A0A8J6A3J2_GALPY|nr:putative ATP-dependent RNA helicase DDX60 [Galemys pyrenaicus]
MVSLLNDFVESDFFLIDGDSLFITCILNKTFKIGQTLHFFYLVEKFLHDFIQKEAKFVIVFFKDAEHLYINLPTLQVLRTTLIEHLENNTNVKIHTEFSNCLSTEWEKFLTEHYPFFLIVSEKGITAHQTEFLHIFILHALQRKINIVLPLGMESDVLRIYGFCASSKYTHKKYFAEICETLSLLQNLWPEGADIRSVVCAISCSVTLKLYEKMLLDAQDHENLNTDTENDSIQDLRKTPTLLEVADLCRMHCLSVIFLQQLPLFQRIKSRIITCVWNKILSPFLKMLKKSSVFILKQLKVRDDWKVDFAGLPDLTDAILWKNIAYYYEVEYPRGINLEMGDTLMQEYVRLWDIIVTLSESDSVGGAIPVRTTSRPFLAETDTLPTGTNTLLNVASLSTQRETGTSFKDAKGRREIQESHHFHHVFEKSLTGSRSASTMRRGAPSPQENATVQKRRTNQTNAETDIEENQERQRAKEEERWKNLFPNIVKEIRKNPNLGIELLEDFLQKCTDKSVKFKAEMGGVHTCYKLWLDNCLKPEAESKDINIIINLMKRIHIVHEKYSEQLQNTHRQNLAECLKDIGFGNLAYSLCPQVNRSNTENAISKYSVGMGAARFQLTYMGPFLFREERSDPDPRVHHFIPDTWQRELLDVVDNNESAVIVAPTSSGKTYASYYCMEKILRESNDGIVIYVAPTKALVNQVVRTVDDLFAKSHPHEEALCGIFTRDYRNDALNCRILVTVPQCLEILLLSPYQQRWMKRVRYVIFDEVHCLGGEIGAEVWEHLLVMIRCPFLALSATISNPDHLTEWLMLTKKYWQHVENSVENSGWSKCVSRGSKKQVEIKTKKASYRVRLVWHKERFNDVEKYVCSLKGEEFLIEHYHPCAALTVNHIKECGIPLDLGFSPRECILLYDAMVHIWPEWPRMQELEPEEFSCFKNKLVIKKADVKKYEEELKKEISCWVEKDSSKVNQLLSFLKPLTFDCSEDEKRKMFPHFVEKLKIMDRLPAIFFIFTIYGVEASALEIFRNLTKKQENHSGSNSTKQKSLDIDVLKAKKSQKKKNAVSSELDSGAEYQREVISKAEMKEINKYVESNAEISSDCSYADDTAVDDETLTELLNKLMEARQGYKLHDLLQRGIGFHHGSMEHTEREVVELLFRKNYVKVVVATSSLALGINMPCKSVVFTEDSCFLDALNFRQMSGRAGRRGEDLVGNVFFYGIPLPKVERLLRSNVPELKGQFPVNISFILRLMILVAKADDKEDAKAKAISALEHSLISFKKPKIKCIIKLYFIYALQFLFTEGYLNQECVPIGLSGLVSHLHYHEPANFVFVRLLVKGFFDKLCVPEKRYSPKKFSEDVMEKLVIVLANLFGRKYLPPCVEDHKRKSDSVVILDGLPQKCAKVIEAYNKGIQNNFVSFLLTISKLADLKKEHQLPLSEIGEECKDSQLVSHLMPGTESRTAVSPFACLSNVTDKNLFDINTLSDVMLRTIDVNVRNIPLFRLNKLDSTGRKYPLNAYLLDFYKHGSLYSLTGDNQMDEGDAYLMLKDFALIIQSISICISIHSISLRELCENEEDNVVLAFEQLSETFSKKLSTV